MRYCLLLSVLCVLAVPAETDGGEEQLQCFSYVTTGDSYSILVLSALWDGEPIPAGYEIAVFDGALCVGGEETTGEYPLGFAAWEDDDQTAVKDGYACEQTMLFKICYPHQSGTQSVCDDQYIRVVYREGDGLFCTGAIAVIDTLECLLPTPSSGYTWGMLKSLYR